MKNIGILFLFIFTTLAFAQEPLEKGWSVGLLAGTGDTSGDEEPDVWGVNAGYQFNRWFGLEAALMQMDDLTFDTRDGDTFSVGETKGVRVMAVGRVPLNKFFAIHAKGGLFFNEMEEELNYNNNRHRDDDVDTSPVGELGFELRFTRKFSVELNYANYSLDYLEWDIIDNDDDWYFESKNMDTYTVTAKFRFDANY